MARGMHQEKAAQLIAVYRDESLPQSTRLAARDEVLASLTGLIRRIARVRAFKTRDHPDARADWAEELEAVATLRCLEFFGCYEPSQSAPCHYFAKIIANAVKDHAYRYWKAITVCEPYTAYKYPNLKKCVDAVFNGMVSVNERYDDEGDLKVDLPARYAEDLVDLQEAALLTLEKLRLTRPRWARVVDLYMQGLDQAEIGQVLDGPGKPPITGERVRQMRARAVRLMRKYAGVDEETGREVA